MLRALLPAFDAGERARQITEPRTRERQNALEQAASQGQVFQVTGGAALNDDDFLIRDERVRLKEQLSQLDKERKEKLASWSRQSKAAVVMAKPEHQWNSSDYQDLIAWKMAKPCPSKVSRKKDREELWAAVKDNVVDEAVEWGPEKEEELNGLAARVESNLTLEDTEYGRQKEIAKDKARCLVASMTPDELADFMRAIADESDRTEDTLQLLVGGGNSSDSE